MQTCAFIFPGQGSQSLGMLSAFASEKIVQDTFAQASKVLDYDLWGLVQNGPVEMLNDTRYTQPAILTASYALWQIWREKGGLMPSLLAGHSLGEYSALVAAGALNFQDAVLLVSQRGAFMQEAVPEGIGAMAAVLGLSDDEVKNICLEAAQDEVLSAVNFNAPGQVVIAGHKTALERALVLIKAQGKRAMSLPVSVPSHCDLMQSAAEKLAKVLESIPLQTPQIPVLNNIDAKTRTEPDAIKHALVAQLYSPVLWVKTIETIAQQTQTFIECGPGKVLTGLNKRINSELATYPTCAPDLFTAALQAVNHS